MNKCLRKERIRAKIIDFNCDLSDGISTFKFRISKSDKTKFKKALKLLLGILKIMFSAPALIGGLLGLGVGLIIGGPVAIISGGAVGTFLGMSVRLKELA